MESNGSVGLDNAESILDQLLKFTAQLAECGNNPQVDAQTLAAKTQVLGKMRDLYSRTQVCLEILQRKSNRAASEVRSLSNAKLANIQQGRIG